MSEEVVIRRAVSASPTFIWATRAFNIATVHLLGTTRRTRQYGGFLMSLSRETARRLPSVDKLLPQRETGIVEGLRRNGRDKLIFSIIGFMLKRETTTIAVTLVIVIMVMGSAAMMETPPPPRRAAGGHIVVRQQP